MSYGLEVFTQDGFNVTDSDNYRFIRLSSGWIYPAYGAWSDYKFYYSARSDSLLVPVFSVVGSSPGILAVFGSVVLVPGYTRFFEITTRIIGSLNNLGGAVILNIVDKK